MQSTTVEYKKDVYLGVYMVIQEKKGYYLVKISQPVSVTSKVCSNWAERLPSDVTAVQLSGLIKNQKHISAL